MLGKLSAHLYIVINGVIALRTIHSHTMIAPSVILEKTKGTHLAKMRKVINTNIPQSSQ